LHDFAYAYFQYVLIFFFFRQF